MAPSTLSTIQKIKSTITGRDPEELEDSIITQVSDATTLSWSTRIKGFIICFCIGVVFSILGVIFLWKNLKSFAVLYSFGNVMALSSTCFLMGPCEQLRNMFDEKRLIATVVMLVCLDLTLCAALWWNTKGLAMLFCILQYLSMTWYCFSYISFVRISGFKCTFSRPQNTRSGNTTRAETFSGGEEFDPGSRLEPVIVRVHQTHLRDDLIKVFSDPEILQQTIKWRLIDDHGREEEGVGAGVQRDIFSTFWQSVFCSYTLGDLEKVPCLHHDLQKSQWEAIGRVLTYGFKYCSYIPVGLSPTFLVSCLHGEDQVDEEELLASFSNFVTSDEREALQMSLSDNPDCQDCDLIDFLSTYKCFRLPTAQNIRDIILELAHQELIQRPRYIAECWAPVIVTLKTRECFTSVQKMRDLFSDLKPSSKKVIQLLKATPSSDSEKQSFDFLKRFVRSLDAASLKIFLKFVTGSDVLITDQISISFVATEGLSRRPIAHTCGPTLEIPSTYQVYNEMVEEFNNILRQKESWTFNIV